MIDTLERLRPNLDSGRARQIFGVPDDAALVTPYRPANVDDPVRAHAIVQALREVGERLPLVFPVHQRSEGPPRSVGLFEIDSPIPLHPLGHTEFASPMLGTSVAITDSGGIREETTILSVPCLTARPNTESPTTISHGTNSLCEPDQIASRVDVVLEGRNVTPNQCPPLWDENARHRRSGVISEWLVDNCLTR